MIPECAACWAKAKRYARPHQGITLATTYRLLLAEHDRAADQGKETPDHA